MQILNLLEFVLTFRVFRETRVNLDDHIEREASSTLINSSSERPQGTSLKGRRNGKESADSGVDGFFKAFRLI